MISSYYVKLPRVVLLGAGGGSRSMNEFQKIMGTFLSKDQLLVQFS